MVGELHDLFVAVRQGVNQHLQIAESAEQIGTRVTQPARCLRQLSQGLPKRVAVSVEGVGGLIHERAQRALHSALLRSELPTQRCQLFLDVVPFDGHCGAVQPDARAIGQSGASGVGGRQLNEPCGHQIRGNDEGLRVGG